MSTALVPKQQQAFNTLRGMLEQNKKQIAACLPSHITPERQLRVALTLCQKNPALLDCTPLSVASGIMQASELGLELSGVLGQAYLVPYKSIAQFQVGYRGLIALAYRSDKVRVINARVVHKNDEFSVSYGTSAYILHKPTFAVDPGEITHVYAVMELKSGAQDFEVMSKEQIEAHRQKYSKTTRPDSPWNTAWEEMAKKTVLRRLCKRAPVSTELVEASVADEYGEQGLLQENHMMANTVEATKVRLDQLKEEVGANSIDQIDVSLDREPGQEG